MKMDAGIDTGPYLGRRELAISNQDTAATLGDRLAALGAELLLESLPEYLAGRIQPIRQDESLATYAGMLKKEEGELDFEQPAEMRSSTRPVGTPPQITQWIGCLPCG